MTAAGPTTSAELRRVAFDLDHVRTLGGLGRRRLESLALAAAEIRALADRREPPAPDPTPVVSSEKS